MNRHGRLYNSPTPGGIIGSKRILTPVNNDNHSVNVSTTCLRDRESESSSSFQIRQRATRARTMSPNRAAMTLNTNTNSNNPGINQSSIQMRSQIELPAAFTDVLGQISEITDGLYLCGAKAIKVPRLRALGITTVFNVTVELPNLHMEKVEYIKIPIEDSPVSNLSVQFDRVADKINSVVQAGGKALVHCMAGISRSASLCIVYLMKYQRMNLRRAFRHVKSQRSIIYPNPGFFRQLMEYEMKLYGSTSMSIVYNSSPARRSMEDLSITNSDLPPISSNANSFKPSSKYRTYISRPLEIPIRHSHMYSR